MSTSSCLVLGEPDVTAPSRTAPELRTTLSQTELQLIYLDTNNMTYPRQNFPAEIRSEDAGSPLANVLLIDYGVLSAGDEPWLDAEVGSPLTPATRADGWRKFSSDWQPQLLTHGAGCHTVTLLATHEALGTPKARLWCPKDPDDFDTLTWFVVLCDEQDCDFDNCPNVSDTTTSTYCDSPLPPDGGSGGTP